MLNMERMNREKIPSPLPPEIHPLLKPNPDHVWVYREGDFKEILGEMHKLLFFITAMHHFQPGSVTRAAISQVLDSEPLLQDELPRVRARP
jgi:hypothetical protein